MLPKIMKRREAPTLVSLEMDGGLLNSFKVLSLRGLAGLHEVMCHIAIPEGLNVNGESSSVRAALAFDQCNGVQSVFTDNR